MSIRDTIAAMISVFRPTGPHDPDARDWGEWARPGDPH
ncbi:MAG: hypothetical protein AVDCRST_MAG70-1740 [uncultured Thermomicrobiales bacterium]|uniref:Uncharacterized protein n=1 Tax=uncultured Thermomicrobiales bacterium TaxID=1645740 RepID=A0A6J4UYG8_9BACT|nr:MAG: hypothetical protein AVDCRST_MAG70-1740 [uncultured Thermomicrobiales bacterium]